MKKSLRLSAIYLGVISASVLATSVAFAHGAKGEHGNYKGEHFAPCPPPCKVLMDGFYVGAQAGYDSYRIRDEINDEGFGFGPQADTVVNATGAVGGLFLGYGRYMPEWYNLYLGVEVFGNDSAASVNSDVGHHHHHHLSSSSSTVVPFFFGGNLEQEITANWSWGVSVLPGIKINDSTLAYARLGWAAHNLKVENEFDHHYLLSSSYPYGFAGRHHDDDDDANHWYSGFAYGLGIESVICQNWSVRGDYTHTDLGSHDVGSTSLHPADNQFMLSLIYHFDLGGIFS